MTVSTEGECVGKYIPYWPYLRRLYADEEAFCQMYHMCVSSTNGEFKKFSFLCPNGTIFDQDKLACNRWFDVDCSTDAIDVRQACWVVWCTQALLSTFLQIAVADLDLLDAERTFITLGLNSDNPEEDHPWKFRKALFWVYISGYQYQHCLTNIYIFFTKTFSFRK